MKQLKQTLLTLRTYRLKNFGISGYQITSDDWQLESVPLELNDLWNNPNLLSFQSQSIHYLSDIDQISRKELVQRIDDEYRLIISLEKIFSNLKSRK